MYMNMQSSNTSHTIEALLKKWTQNLEREPSEAFKLTLSATLQHALQKRKPLSFRTFLSKRLQAFMEMLMTKQSKIFVGVATAAVLIIIAVVYGVLPTTPGIDTPTSTNEEKEVDNSLQELDAQDESYDDAAVLNTTMEQIISDTPSDAAEMQQKSGAIAPQNNQPITPQENQGNHKEVPPPPADFDALFTEADELGASANASLAEFDSIDESEDTVSF